MALTGKELVTVYGNVNATTMPAATTELVTTQNIANLNTGGTGVVGAGLVGNEAVYVRGVRPDGYASATLFATTTGAIAALGSIAPSTLTGKELVVLGTSLTGTVVPSGPLRTATTLQIGG